MNQAIHQLIQLILQGLTWFLRTIETLWVGSWSQISGVLSTPWDSLPGWKIALAPLFKKEAPAARLGLQSIPKLRAC